MKLHLAFLFIVALLSLSLVMPAHASTSTVTWYFRADTHTVNGVTAYVINETISDTAVNVTDSVAGNVTVYWGWRIWRVRSDGSQNELTSGTPVATVSRVVSGIGIQTGTWNAPSKVLHIGYDCFKFVLYMKFGSGDWTAKATFVSSRLLERAIVGATWSFKIYTVKQYVVNTYGVFVWGSSAFNSRIEGIEFEEPDVYQHMNYLLQTGDFVGFILYPYLNLVGNIFYGLVMLTICVPIYNRYHSFTPILIIFIIFGGAGGLFTLLTPVAGLNISWIFLLLGLAGLLYRTFR